MRLIKRERSIISDGLQQHVKLTHLHLYELGQRFQHARTHAIMLYYGMHKLYSRTEQRNVCFIQTCYFGMVVKLAYSVIAVAKQELFCFTYFVMMICNLGVASNLVSYFAYMFPNFCPTKTPKTEQPSFYSTKAHSSPLPNRTDMEIRKLY